MIGPFRRELSLAVLWRQSVAMATPRRFQRTLTQMQGFRDAVDVCNLVDLGYSGNFWTWEKKVVGGTYTLVRLDRALGSAEWCAQFPLANVSHIDTATSDHRGLLLNLTDDTDLRRGNCQFRYEAMWDRHPELKPTVTASWLTEESSSASEVRGKLANLANDLGKWGLNTFGSVRKEIRKLKSELEHLRNLPGRVGPSHVDIKVNDNLIVLYHREEVMRRQRSRVQWLNEGDKNSKFFHQRASMRWKKNLVKSLTRADGQVTEDVNEMQVMTGEFYKKLYTSEGVQGMNQVLQHVPRMVTLAMNEILTAPFVADEVKRALFSDVPTESTWT
ncbi:hypothetical protein ACQ4PT_046881 [Festuca glaucescens]